MGFDDFLPRADFLRIVIFTPWFYPHLGGVETVSDLLASGLSSHGIEVSVITSFPSGEAERQRPYRILRCPSVAASWRAVHDADAVLMLGPSLKFIWIPLAQRKPLVINHYTWTPWRNRPLISLIQRSLCLVTCNIAPSKIMAQHIGLGTSVMPNPFDDRVFRSFDVPRDRDLVFLGRLVKEKGLHTLLHALQTLQKRGVKLRLTVIGQGPAEDNLKVLANGLGLQTSVSWRGPLSGEPLARELARHRILVAPSLWREPFGIIALEGLACGCRLVVSDNGGLLEAAGPHAIRFEAGNALALADAIGQAWDDESSQAARAEVELHLKKFSINNVARQYMQLFSTLTAPSQPSA